MGNSNSDADSFGDIVPQAAIDIPTTVGGYLTHGDDGRGTETRVVENFQTKPGQGSGRGQGD